MTTLLIYWGGPLLGGWGIKGQHTEVSSPLRPGLELKWSGIALPAAASHWPLSPLL